MSLRLSPHFTLAEMTTTQVRGVSNEPTPTIVDNLTRLCVSVLEPIRAEFGPLHITSGYRSPEVNARIGGSKSSAHMQGLAADFVPLKRGVTLRQVYEWLADSQRAPQYDQSIYEFGRWLHVGLAPLTRPMRGQALMIFGGTGYLQFDPKHPLYAGKEST